MSWKQSFSLLALFVGHLITSGVAAQTLEPASAQSTLPDAPSSYLPSATAALSLALPPEQQSARFQFTRDVFSDERAFFTSTAHVRPKDLRWMLPLIASSAVLVASDGHSQSIAHISPSDQREAGRFSNGFLAATAAVPAGMYLFSKLNDAPRARQTAILSTEGVADSLLLTGAMKLVFRRSSPRDTAHPDQFFASSVGRSSFPSAYSSAAWSVAAVVGDEHPGWLTRTLIYGLAASTSISQGISKRNSPGDIVVGSALGWLAGHYVSRTHSRDATSLFQAASGRLFSSTSVVQQRNLATSPAIESGTDPAMIPAQNGITGAAAANTASGTTVGDAANGVRVSSLPQATTVEPYIFDPDKAGSPNIPMDSWVYPALERLSAMGFIPTQSTAIRPWTRVECYRQIQQASELYENTDPDGPRFSTAERGEAARLLNDLHHEFDTTGLHRNSQVVESIYARVGTIAGPAVNDSYHLGQTWWNDFGRPQGQGSNAIFGISGYATAGRTFLYLREEAQHGPGTRAYPLSLEQLISGQDDNPVTPTFNTAAFTRFRPIEMYAGLAFDGNVLSFGKQEIYWGPTTMGGFSFSSNAEPTYNLRFVSGRPHPLPFFPKLGTYRFDIVFGKLSGHHWPNLPYFNGQKANFNFGPNFEVSFTRWSVIWGIGHPMNLHTLVRNLTSVSSTDTCAYGVDCDAGARNSEFDFRYHLPWMRHLVTLYADSYIHDSVNPIADPRKSVWGPGIYFARLPGLPHMDLRVEASSSDRLTQDTGVQLYFFDHQYHDMGTNKGFMLGNAVGRDARAEEVRLGWWFSARTRVEGGYRQTKGGQLLLPHASTLSDGFLNGSIRLSDHWQAKVFAQYERFLIPAYMPTPQHNTSSRFELIWTPGKR